MIMKSNMSSMDQLAKSTIRMLECYLFEYDFIQGREAFVY